MAAYVSLILCIAIATPIGSAAPGATWGTVAGIFLISGARFLHCRKRASQAQKRVPAWKIQFAYGVYLNATIWGLFAAYSIVLFGQAWTPLYILVLTAGLAAGGSSSLAPSLRLVRTFFVVLLGPPMLACLAGGLWSMAAMMSIFTVYMVRLGTNQSRWFWDGLIANTTLETQKVELALAKAQAEGDRDFVSTVIDRIGALVLTTDQDGRVVSFNLACEISSGRTAFDVAGVFFWEALLDPQEAEAARVLYLEDQRNAPKARCNSSWLHRDGSRHFIRWTLSSLADSQGNPAEVVWIGTDITAENEAKSALKQSEKRYLESERALDSLAREHAQILDTIDEGIYRVTLEGLITYANPACAAIVGYALEEIVGQEMDSAMRSSLGDKSVSPILLTARDGVTRRVTDEVFRHKNGTPIPVEYTCSPLVDEGLQDGVVVVFRDISERLVAKRTKDEFLSVVSHELRTPLSSIRGALGLLASGAMGEMPAGGQRMMEIASASTQRLERLVNDILDIERLESGTLDLALEECQVGPLMEEAAESLRGFAHDAKVEVECVPAQAIILADPDRVTQILTNLLGNAIKFSEAGKSVRLSATTGERELTFEVRDQGRGIPEDKLETIFERFKQVDASDSREKGGTGLGLSISQSLVEKHGGRIWVDSALGQGSVFRFTVPLAGG